MAREMVTLFPTPGTRGARRRSSERSGDGDERGTSDGAITISEAICITEAIYKTLKLPQMAQFDHQDLYERS